MQCCGMCCFNGVLSFVGISYIESDMNSQNMLNVATRRLLLLWLFVLCCFFRGVQTLQSIGAWSITDACSAWTSCFKQDTLRAQPQKMVCKIQDCYKRYHQIWNVIYETDMSVWNFDFHVHIVITRHITAHSWMS
jgi:hypothetical protein